MYEYTMFRFNIGGAFTNECQKITDKANELAKYGWRVIGVTNYNELAFIYVMFERKVD